MPKTKTHYDSDQLNDLLLQMLETELGGEQAYRAALTCAVNSDLKKEWEEYLGQTLIHQQIVLDLCDAVGLDPDQPSTTRAIVEHIGESLVKAIELAKQGGKPAAAQVVASECVVLAETKDQAKWELLGKIAESASGDIGRTLQAAFEAVEIDEGRHSHHTLDWSCELSMAAIGLPAVLPPAAEVARAHRANDEASVAHRATA
jgi:hypothetical protein